MNRKLSRRGSLFGGKSKVETIPGLPFRLRDDYLSPEQLSFLKLLLAAVGDIYIICPRVSLADIFSIIDEHRHRHLADSLRQKKIDLLLCDPHTMIPLAGLELAGKCNPMEKTRDQEVFIDDIFESAKLPLIRIYAANPCNPEDLRESILEVTGGNEISPEKIKISTEEEPSAEDQHLNSNLPDALSCLEEAGLKDWRQEKLFKQPAPQLESIGISMQISEERQDRLTAAGEYRQEMFQSTELPASKLPGRQPETVNRPATTGGDPPRLELYDNGRSGEVEVTTSADEMAAGTSVVKSEIRPARFMHSQTEQTPGIDFFTGSVSDVGRSPFVAEKGDILPGDEVSSEVGPIREDRLDPGVDFNNNPWNLEQLKIKMKREIEQAARESMQSGTPACPRCAATMSLRTSKRGYRFYACANYPHCREVKGLYE